MGSPNLPPNPNPTRVAALQALRARSTLRPRLGIVLGSGFGALAGILDVEADVAYPEIPGFVPGSVPGHAGRLLLGHLGGLPVAVLAGRTHYYEGHGLDVVTFPVRILRDLGAEAILLTNAAGGIRADLEPGDFVALVDHLNFMGANPLRGSAPGERFVDLSEVYDPGLRSRLMQAGDETGTRIKEGVYLAVAGPNYETPAEIRAFAGWGADLVGMSTVPEAIVARQEGLRVAGLSCVSNRAAGLGGRICHEEVLEVGRRASAAATRLLLRFAQLLGRELGTDTSHPGSGSVRRAAGKHHAGSSLPPEAA